MAGLYSGALGPGDRLGPYRLVRVLGAGGMGTVHEAVEEGLGRSVALKLIAPALAHDPAFRAGFTQEARAQASLDSPHVVQVFAHGEIDGPYTWWSMRGRAFDNDSGWRIDYHLATPALAARATNYQVVRAPSWDTRWSDHSPVVADYSIGV